MTNSRDLEALSAVATISEDIERGQKLFMPGGGSSQCTSCARIEALGSHLAGVVAHETQDILEVDVVHPVLRPIGIDDFFDHVIDEQSRARTATIGREPFVVLGDNIHDGDVRWDLETDVQGIARAAVPAGDDDRTELAAGPVRRRLAALAMPEQDESYGRKLVTV